MDKLLKQPIEIGKVKIHNRLVMPPMQISKGTNSLINQEAIEYYNERTQGGKIGLLVTEHLFVSPEGRAHASQFSIASDDTVEGLKNLVDMVHANGSRVFAQIAHAGSSAPAELVGAENVISASAVENTGCTAKAGNSPKELTKEEIKVIVDAFVKAALRAERAGFDGIEIHGAHGYFLNQFWSPLTNHREDEYGGSVENRLRIHVEILNAIKAAVKPDFAVGIRFGAHDFKDGGATMEDAAEGFRILADTGVDFMDVSAGMGGPYTATREHFDEFVALSKLAKDICSVPVIYTGGIKTAEAAEDILQKGAADMIGVGRALFAKPDWARTAMQD